MTAKTYTIDSLPVKLAEGKHELVLSLKDPGRVRAMAFTLSQRLIMSKGEPEFDENLTMFVEFEKDGPMRTRRFVFMHNGQQLGVPDGKKLEYLATAVSQASGVVVHVFEVKDVS